MSFIMCLIAFQLMTLAVTWVSSIYLWVCLFVGIKHSPCVYLFINCRSWWRLIHQLFRQLFLLLVLCIGTSIACVSIIGKTSVVCWRSSVVRPCRWLNISLYVGSNSLNPISSGEIVTPAQRCCAALILSMKDQEMTWVVSVGDSLIISQSYFIPFHSNYYRQNERRSW
jgi:hypothetical protein